MDFGVNGQLSDCAGVHYKLQSNTLHLDIFIVPSCQDTHARLLSFVNECTVDQLQ